jgi:hypothetical protein
MSSANVRSEAPRPRAEHKVCRPLKSGALLAGTRFAASTLSIRREVPKVFREVLLPDPYDAKEKVPTLYPFEYIFLRKLCVPFRVLEPVDVVAEELGLFRDEVGSLSVPSPKQPRFFADCDPGR